MKALSTSSCATPVTSSGSSISDSGTTHHVWPGLSLLQRGAEQLAVGRDEAGQPVATGAGAGHGVLRAATVDRPALAVVRVAHEARRRDRHALLGRALDAAQELRRDVLGRQRRRQVGVAPLLVVAARLVAAEGDRAIEPVVGQLGTGSVVDLLEGVVADVGAAALAVRAVGEADRQLEATEGVGGDALGSRWQGASVLIAECASAAIAGRDGEPAARARADGSVAVAHASSLGMRFAKVTQIRHERCKSAARGAS